MLCSAHRHVAESFESGASGSPEQRTRAQWCQLDDEALSGIPWRQQGRPRSCTSTMYRHASGRLPWTSVKPSTYSRGHERVVVVIDPERQTVGVG